MLLSAVICCYMLLYSGAVNIFSTGFGPVVLVVCQDDWLLPPEVSGSASNDLKDVDDLAGPSEGEG